MAANFFGLTIDDIHKRFGETIALSGVSFQVHQGDIMAVLGPSGCGKSTLLSIIAGLERPDQGSITWDSDKLDGIPPHKRNFGLMFQDFALFPHRDVFHNVAFGLQMARLPGARVEQRVRESLDLVGLPGFENRDVNTLSGGESQRVALARSLAPHPRLLMLDEPLGSLDRNLRERLLVDLRRILRASQQTAIYVTHDQEEAFAIADCVVVMKDGRVEQIDTPQSIYRQPANPFVARFVGLNNLLPGEIRPGVNGLEVQTPIGAFPVFTDLSSKVTVLIRSDRVELSATGDCQIRGVLQETSFRGNSCLAVIQVDSTLLIFDFPSNAPLPKIGDRATLSFDPRRTIQIFPRENEN